MTACASSGMIGRTDLAHPEPRRTLKRELAAIMFADQQAHARPGTTAVRSGTTSPITLFGLPLRTISPWLSGATKMRAVIQG